MRTMIVIVIIETKEKLINNNINDNSNNNTRNKNNNKNNQNGNTMIKFSL